MSAISTSALDPMPVRSLSTDDPREILRFAADAFTKGDVALATLTEIRGGAARALGSHVVVTADGHFCGYVSGGCVEAAVAAEAMRAIAEGRDRAVKFGIGSPFFDIVLPCGGGITVAIHVLQEVGALHEVLMRLERRETAGLQYCAERESLIGVEAPTRPSFLNGDFTSAYCPPTRIIVSGNSIEAEAVASIGKASGYDVVSTEWTGDEKRLAGAIDAFTAIVLLHHDLDAEHPVLDAALRSPAFYIGALGSTRTHRRRVVGLIDIGWSKLDIDRIRAPIGMFGPARDARSLALSVLADVAACRLASNNRGIR